jgi:hypothetical protein
VGIAAWRPLTLGPVPMSDAVPVPAREAGDIRLGTPSTNNLNSLIVTVRPASCVQHSRPRSLGSRGDLVMGAIQLSQGQFLCRRIMGASICCCIFAALDCLALGATGGRVGLGGRSTWYLHVLQCLSLPGWPPPASAQSRHPPAS